MKMLLTKIKYDEHKWMVCGDLKVLSIMLGQLGVIPNTLAFCVYGTVELKISTGLVSNCQREMSLQLEKRIFSMKVWYLLTKYILLPPLHVKLGLMKQYVKSLDKSGKCFKYICQKFSFLSDEKLKAGMFDGPKMRQLLKDKEFIETMNPEEKNGWVAFSQVVNNFLGNTKSPESKKIVKTLLDNFHKLGCNMSVKVHFLHSHLEYFLENLGALSKMKGFTKTLKSWTRDTKVDGTLV